MLNDPSTWKREHKLALILAIGLGAVLGAMFGLRETAYIGPWGTYWNRGIMYDIFGWGGYVAIVYWTTVVGWAVFGGAIGGALV